MTTANMLSRVRTLLDEASASFWSDTEIYSALADGQNEIITFLLNIYRIQKKANSITELPQVLRTLHVSAAGTSATGIITAPADLLYLIGGYYSNDSPTQTIKPFIVKDYGQNYMFDYYNTYLAPSANDPQVIIANNSSTLSIYFIPAPTGGNTAAYAYDYLKTPSAIASGVEPTLPVHTHNAIIQYAFSFLLLKDDRMQESQAEYQKFLQSIQNFMQV